ncbi:MAG: hypothetical protein ACREUT_02005 [Steroidobacteraceae bacterium]
MTPGRVLLAAAAALIACSCSTLPQEASGLEPTARQFEAEIAHIERADPASPAVLSARLTYAEFLLNESTGPCAPRLARARAELRTAAESPKARAMFPDGWARTADLEYRLHLARATCGSASTHDFELWAAADSARRAVELYRDAFDYHSMVIMQFDAGIPLHRLGQKTAAIAALRAAIAMDREYGFLKDTEENYGLLLSWEGEPSSPERVAALMHDFPKRHVTLQFRWHAGDAAVAVGSRRARLEDGKLTQSRAAASLEERVRSDRDGWSVSYDVGRDSGYDAGVWPATQGTRTPEDIFPPALLASPSFRVSRTGEFQSVSHSDAFAQRIASDAARLIRAHAPAGRRARTLTREALETATAELSPELLEAAARRNYSLETAMWVGARLDQGVWYSLSAPLALPGIPRVVMQQSIEFAFTRTVPCTARSAERTCIEIVLHVTPQQDALARWLADMRADGSLLHYASSLDIRIVTDPRSLMPCAREERAYWYASVGNGRGDQLLESEHTTSSTDWLASRDEADRVEAPRRPVPH